MVWGWNKDWRGQRTSDLLEGEQGLRQINRGRMHGTGVWHRIAQVEALCCYGGTRDRGAWRSELAGSLRIAPISVNVHEFGVM